MTTFNVNEKALQSLSTKAQLAHSVKEAFEARTKTKIDSCGGTSEKVVGYPAEGRYMKKEGKWGYVEGTGVRPSHFSHGLIETVHLSYAEHYPLVLSPDHIWLTIAQGLALHINKNAEALRKRFVNFEGQKTISIRRDGFVKGQSNNWAGVFPEFSDKLSEFIGKKRDLIVCNFSTTDAISKIASEIVLMESMKAYFRYEMTTCCGVPHITLLGTRDDWRDISVRAENLMEYDLEWWIKPLLPVLRQFELASEGNVDVEFWDMIYKQLGGSGGPFIGGWILKLFPYLEGYGESVKNPYLEKPIGMFDGPTTDSFPNSVSKVPFIWNYYGSRYEMEFLGGIVGAEQASDLSVMPSVGWAVQDANQTLLSDGQP